MSVGWKTAVVVLGIFAFCYIVYDMTHEQNIGRAFVDVTADAVDNVVDNVNKLINSFVGSKAEEKEDVALDTQQYHYWTASIVNGVVTPGIPLTYSQARDWVAAEINLLCSDHASAVAIVKFYPSAIWHSAHGGGTKCGYLNHYHMNKGHDHKHNNHIWYYGE